MLLIEWTASAKLDLLEILDYMLLKSADTNLLQNISVARLVDFECFAAVGAVDFMHIGSSCFLILTPFLFYQFLVFDISFRSASTLITSSLKDSVNSRWSSLLSY